MPSFGPQSKSVLDTCCRDLNVVCNRAIQRVDFSVIEGVRDTATQQRYFRENKTTLDGVTQLSKHQLKPGQTHSHAVDLLPYPGVLNGVNVWADDFRFTLFAGEMLATGWEVGVELRWGGDWNGDGSRADQTFHDLPHFEVVY